MSTLHVVYTVDEAGSVQPCRSSLAPSSTSSTAFAQVLGGCPLVPVASYTLAAVDGGVNDVVVRAFARADAMAARAARHRQVHLPRALCADGPVYGPVVVAAFARDGALQSVTDTIWDGLHRRPAARAAMAHIQTVVANPAALSQYDVDGYDSQDDSDYAAENDANSDNEEGDNEEGDSEAEA